MTKNEILEALAAESGPVTNTVLATALGVKASEVTTPVKRMVESGEVERNEEGELSITEKGKALIAPPPPSQSDVGATEYDRFKALGNKLGVKADLLDVATDHVWNGGDYNDLNWVWTAMGEMGIRKDLKLRWWNAWRSLLNQPIPTDLKEAVAPSEESAPAKSQNFDYIIVDDEPVRVGAGLGDYGLQDAKDIISIRALRNRFNKGGSPAASSAPGQGGERIADILTALGPYLNKDTDLGTVKEIISARMALLEQRIASGAPQPPQQKSFLESVTEMVAALGSLKEAGPVLRSLLGVPEQSNPGSPLQLPGADGKPMILDPKALDAMINWERFRGDEKRADDKMEMVKGLVQDARMLAPDAVGALKATAEAYNKMAPGSGQGAPSTEAPPESPAIEGICPSCQEPFTLTEIPTGDVQCPHCGAVLTPAAPQQGGAE